MIKNYQCQEKERKMPRGFTESVKKAMKTFEKLKKESLIKGKNLATIANVAKQSGTSRTNFYEKKSKDWEELVLNIEDFSREFQTLAKGKYKNPEVEAYKETAKECEKKYNTMAKQNYDLLKKVNDLERIIADKQETIKLLKERLND